MTIFGALGLALTIVVLKVLVPEIFHSLEGVILSLLHTVNVFAAMATQLATSASALHAP